MPGARPLWLWLAWRFALVGMLPLLLVAVLGVWVLLPQVRAGIETPQLIREALPRMADLYKLLANPARLKILLVLSRTEQMCVSDLAAVLELSIAATSHQLKLLKDRGWLRGKGDGKLIYYSLANEGLKDALEGDLRLLSEAASP